MPPADTKQNTDGEKNNRGHSITAFFFDVKITDVLLALFTFMLWWSTHKLWHSAQEQGSGMKRPIREASRAASAMEGVSRSMARNVDS